MNTFTPQGRLRGPILPGFVLREKVSPGAKILYAVLCNHASEKDHCWPSHKFLATELGYSVSSIKNWLAELVRVRLLTIRRTAYRASTYVLLSPGREAREPKIGYPQANIGYRNNSKESLKTFPPYPQAARAPKGGRTNPRRRGVGDFLSVNAAFERFAAHYPRHEAREAARAVWHRLSRRKALPPLDALLAALARFRESSAWNREHGRFVPYLVNWLKDRRWLDEEAHVPEQPTQQSKEQTWRLEQAMARLRETHMDPRLEAARPQFEAFLARFVVQGKRGPAWGLWSSLFRKGNAPSAADVKDRGTMEVLPFLQAWQRGDYARA